MANVFVVDDESYIQDLYRAALPVGGHVVVGTASNGCEAVDKYPTIRPPPDVVLMDYRMPEMDGLEATRKIRASHPDSRVVVISADATVGPRCAGAGAAAFMEKPFNLPELFLTIDKTASGPAGAPLEGRT